jgi:transcriptional regulator with XRE-family HTH domain
MARTLSVRDWMVDRGISKAQIVEASGLDPNVIEAIIAMRYTPSPEQRRRVAEVLKVDLDRICWAYQVEVAHVYGHGPQFGRSP